MNDPTPKVQEKEAGSDLGAEGRVGGDMRNDTSNPVLPRHINCPTCAIQYSMPVSFPDPPSTDADP